MHVIYNKTYNLEQLDIISNEIIDLLSSEDRIWLLNGSMGAGKTTLTQALLKHISSEKFKGSPTFSLVNVYPVDIYKDKQMKRLFHFDLYRLNDLEEAWDIGVEDMWSDPQAISIIEWSEKAHDILPKKTISLDIEIIQPDLRRLIIYKN